MRQKGSALLPIIIIVVLVGVLGYFIYQNTQLRSGEVGPSPTITNSATNSPKPSPTPDLTANWKTYTSSEISFKYPGNLTLEERQKNYFVLLSDSKNPLSVVISIDARLTGNYANYDNAVISTKAGLTNIQAQELDNGIRISGKVGPGYGEGQQITIALLKYQQGAIEAETTSINSSEQQIFDQMLSTFKFTQ